MGRTYTPKKCQSVSTTDLPTILASWQRAMNSFHALFINLNQLIQLRRQPLSGHSWCYTGTGGRLSVSELEQIRRQMLAELHWLNSDMNQPKENHQDATSLQRLVNHTQRLHQQSIRIQRTLG